MKHNRLKLIAVAAALCAGCASVNVTKVNRDTGAAVAGAAEGIRYYMPRPYVSVHEPFIIASEVHLANGEISPDGQYVLVTAIAESGAAIFKGLAAAPGGGMGQMAIRASEVRADTAAGGNKGGQQGAVGDTAAGDPKSGATAPTPPASAPTDGASAPKPPASAPANDSGILNYKVSNDNAAFAVTPQPRYYSILWLPDFDEQYAVTAKAGLGNAGVTINTGQGWSLQGLDAKVDNSALAGPLLDFYKSTLGSLGKLATAKIGGLSGAISGQQSAVDDKSGPTAKDLFTGGTKVTLKVTKVRVVAPGLYPVLKPGEASDIDAAIKKAGDGANERILRPVPPLTNIAFNTYNVVVIEAAKSTGDSALSISQYVDSGAAPVFSGTNPSPKPEKTNPPIDAAQLQTAINAELDKTITKLKKQHRATVTGVDPKFKVVVRETNALNEGTAASLPSKDDVANTIIRIAKSKSGVLTRGDIEFE